MKETVPIGYVILDHESWQVCTASSRATEVAPRMAQVARLCPKVMLLDATLLFFPHETVCVHISALFNAGYQDS